MSITPTSSTSEKKPVSALDAPLSSSDINFFKFIKLDQEVNPNVQEHLNTPPSSPEQSLTNRVTPSSPQETVEKIQFLTGNQEEAQPFALDSPICFYGTKFDWEVPDTQACLNTPPSSPKQSIRRQEERIQPLTTGDYSAYKTSAEKSVILSKEEAKEILQLLGKKAPSLKSLEYSQYEFKKDQYENILQLIETMVPVYENDVQVDYNGAVFVNPLNGQKYILMQGPLRWTVDLTKKVMEQHKVGQIVCLTKDKCYPYWEKWASAEQDGFTLRTPAADEGWGTLEMFHYEKWPDRGTPKDINEFMQFVAWQRNAFKEGTITVHCSAGIGRTGVFMVVTLMLDLIEKGAKELNPVELVAQLRSVRPGMVQTDEQLMFCYEIANRLLSKSK